MSEAAQERVTVEAAMRSITGFDEVAIHQAFRVELVDMRNPLRALVFVMERRGGASDGDAFRTAMSMGLGEADAYFASDEVDEGKASTGD